MSTTLPPTDVRDEHKSVVAFEVKDTEKGEVEAIIATCGVIDKDFDIITLTAIKDGSKVKMSSYGHDVMWGEQPVGKGTLSMDGDKAVFRGKLFLATQGGRETFEVLKEMGKDQEWSFGFRVLGSEIPSEELRKKGAQRILTKLDCFEVSPVVRGAGEGTRTVAVKEETPPASPPELTAEEIAAKAVADQAVEVARVAAEKQAADDAATRAVEEKAAADRAAEEGKARTMAAVDEFHRVQRTLKRLGCI